MTFKGIFAHFIFGHESFWYSKKLIVSSTRYNIPMQIGKVPKFLALPVIRDERGAMSVIEFEELGMTMKRAYFLFDVQAEAVRGGHAHKELVQLLLVPSGSYQVRLQDGLGKEYRFSMRNPSTGLIVPPGFWRDLDGFSSGAVCLVFASAPYEESDYIRDFEKFCRWKARCD